tara:strand:+ start:1364 stop:1516 length:153 start_codon:yes stop_codon:yes gene_type:complete
VRTGKNAIAIFLPQLLSSLPFLIPFIAISACFNSAIPRLQRQPVVAKQLM